MLNLIKTVNEKVDSVIFSLAFNGIILMMLAFVIIVYPYGLQVIVAIVVFVLGLTFVHGAWKLSHVRREVKRYFKL